MAEIYTTLDIESYQIRVLQILPGPEGSTVRAKLQRHALFNTPRYAALSYCWGDESNGRQMFVNDVSVTITASLESALQRLRTMGVELVWADAICINQQDQMEKSFQVRNMKQVYAKAETVYIWLGISRQAASGLQYLQDMSLLALSHAAQSDYTDGASVKSQPETCRELEYARDNLRALMKCAYWQRRWVIQEVTAASQALVLCRDVVLRLDNMVEVMDHCTESAHWDGELQMAYTFLRRIIDFRNAYQNGRKLDLVNALLTTQNSLSTDCRDKIYALLGICADAHELVPIPSYQQSPESVVMHLTRELLRHNSCLDLITAKRKTNYDLLPSWCPDWLADQIPSSVAQAASEKGYLARSKCNIMLGGDLTELHVQGVDLGRVVTMSSIISSPLPEGESSHFEAEHDPDTGQVLYGRDTTSAILMCLLSTDHQPRALKSESDSKRLYSMLQAVNQPGTLSTTKLIDIEPGETEHIWAKWIVQNNEMKIEGRRLQEWLEQSWPLNLWVRFVVSPYGALFRSLGFSRFKLPLFVLNFIIVPDLVNTCFMVLQFLAVLPLYLALVIVSFCVGSTIPVSKLETTTKPPSIAPNLSRRLILADKGVLGMATADVEEGDRICFIAGCRKAIILRLQDNEDEKYSIVGSTFVCLSKEHTGRYKAFLTPFTKIDRVEKAEKYNSLLKTYSAYDEWREFILV